MYKLHIKRDNIILKKLCSYLQIDILITYCKYIKQLHYVIF